MMLEDFNNVDLEQKPGATPFRNVLDLAIWQAKQLEVGKVNGEARHREPELVEVCKKRGPRRPMSKSSRRLKCERTAPKRSLKPRGRAQIRVRCAVAPSAPTPTRPTRSSARSLEYRIIEMWVRLLESNNSRPWCPGENHGTSSYALDPGLHFVPLSTSSALTEVRFRQHFILFGQGGRAQGIPETRKLCFAWPPRAAPSIY
jgi:hypothetical protein